MAQIEQPKRIVQSVPLPTEIVGEILLRLPVESLLRCKSVCKLWLSLISDPRFIQDHLMSVSTRNKNHHHRLIWWNEEIWKTCSVSDALSSSDGNNNNVLQLDNPCQEDVFIAGSCNGLVCLFTWSCTVFIWNPSTRKSYCLPPCPLTLCTYGFGFGYDHSTDDYKVVAISGECLADDESQAGKSMIYSLKTGKWKDIAYYPFRNPAYLFGRPDLGCWCFSNGALYWSIREPKNCWAKIVSLDLATETYREVLQPVFDDDYTSDYDYEIDSVFLPLGTWEESLCVLHNYRGECVNVWVYGSVKDSWTKLMSIPYETTVWKDSQLYRALFISNDGKILFQDRWDLLVYDSENRSFSEIQNFDGGCEVCTFVESLVSPHAPTGIEDNN